MDEARKPFAYFVALFVTSLTSRNWMSSLKGEREGERFTFFKKNVQLGKGGSFKDMDMHPLPPKEERGLKTQLWDEDLALGIFSILRRKESYI